MAAAAAAALCGLVLALGTAEAISASPYRALALAGDREARVDCWVTGAARRVGDRWLIPIQAVGLDGAPAAGRLEAAIPREVAQAGPPQPGAPLTLQGRLYLPGEQLNPYESDYRRDLAREGVCARCDVRALTQRSVGPATRLWQLVRLLPARLAGWCSLRLGRLVEAHLHGDEQALALAFLLGDRTQLREAPLQSDLEAAGGLHLAAVSGLHVGLVAGAVAAAASLLRMPRGTRTAAVLGTASLYALVSGATPSVLRALVMVGCVTLCPRRRRAVGLNSLGCAALLLIVRRPLIAGDAGFQLSFMATLGILAAAAGPVAKTGPASAGAGVRKLRGVLTAARASLYAQLATMPVMSHCFYRLAPWAPINNLVLLPLGGACITITFAAACLGLIWQPLFGVFAPLLAAALRILAATAHYMGRFPGSMYVTGHPGIPACALSAGLMLWYLLSAGVTGGTVQPRWKPAAAVAASILLVVVYPAVVHRPPGGLAVSFFAVGRLRAGEDGSDGVLVDFGPPGAGGAPGLVALFPQRAALLRATRCFPQLAVPATHPHAGIIPAGSRTPCGRTRACGS